MGKKEIGPYDQTVRPYLENAYKSLENLDIITQREIGRRARHIAMYGRARSKDNNLSLLGITENDAVFEEIRKQGLPREFVGRYPWQQDPILKKISESYGFPLPSVEIEERLRIEIQNTRAGILNYEKSKNNRLTDEERVEIWQKELKLLDKKEQLRSIELAFGEDSSISYDLKKEREKLINLISKYSETPKTIDSEAPKTR